MPKASWGYKHRASDAADVAFALAKPLSFLPLRTAAAAVTPIRFGTRNLSKSGKFLARSAFSMNAQAIPEHFPATEEAPSTSQLGIKRFPDALQEYRLTSGVRARTVVHVCRTGTLCTASTKHSGAPFGSHVDFVLDESGRPVFLLAEAALHTKNIAAEPRVSLYCQPPSAAGQDGCRVTLVGSIERMPEPEAAEIREDYIDAHLHAADALKFPDLFAFHRMTVRDVYFVGGFGVVSQWVDPNEFATSEPDPLAYDAAVMMAEINKDKQEELQRLCEVYLGLDHVGMCTMMGLDRLGFDLRVRTSEGEIREYRLGFRERVRTRFDCHSALVKVFQEAWERQNGDAEMWESEGTMPAVMYFALK